MIYIIKNRNFDKHFHDWQTNKDTPYVYNLNSSRKAALNARGGREGRQKPPPVPRTTFLQIVGTFYVASVDIYSEIPTVPGRLPFASMTSRGSTVLPSPEPVFVSPVLFLLWPSWTRIRESTYPTSSTYRSLLYSLAWLSRLARFNRPCRVFNGYISRHFEMPDTGAQDILLADILSR